MWYCKFAVVVSTLFGVYTLVVTHIFVTVDALAALGVVLQGAFHAFLESLVVPQTL